MTSFGHDYMLTPSFERFAKESLVFEQAHVQSQMCVPTRNSFMTGRRPEQTLVFNDGVGNKHFRVVGENWTTLPQHFVNHGYFTTGVGKTFHPNAPPNFDQPFSWSDLDQYPYFYPKVMACPNTSDVWCSISEPNATFEDKEIYTEAVRRLTYAKSVEAQRPFFVNVGFHKVGESSFFVTN